MGGRPTFVGFIALAIAMLGVGTFAAPRSAMSEIRVPLPGTENRPVKRKRFVRPQRPSRNPTRVAAGVSAASISPKIAENSEAAVVAGTSSSASVALALRAPARAQTNETEAPEPNAPVTELADAEDETGREETAKDETEEDASVSDDADTVNGDIASADARDDGDERALGEDPRDEDVASAETETGEVDPTSVSDVDAEESDGDVSAGTLSEGDREDVAETEAGNTGGADLDGTTAETESAEIEPIETDPIETVSVETDPRETDPVETETVTAEVDETETPASAADETDETVEESIDTAAVEESEASEPAQSAVSEDAEVIHEISDMPDIAPQEPARSIDGTSVVLQVAPPPDDVLSATPANEDGTDRDASPVDATADATLDEETDEQAETKLAALTPPNASATDASAESLEAVTAADTVDETEATAERSDEDPDIASEERSSAEEEDETETAPRSADVAADESDAAGDTDKDRTGAAEDGEADASDQDVVIAVSEPPPPPAHPVVAAVREKLEEPGKFKSLAASDLTALKTFYGEHEDPPLWIAETGFTQKAKTIMETIAEADNWALEASSFNLPAADAVPATAATKAENEIALSAAILSYARDAQIGRLSPSRVSKLFDQHPKLRDPKTVLSEIAGSETPERSLMSLHPQHAQFKSLQQALVRARDSAKIAGRDPERDRNVQRIVMNMERWRWLPRELGNYYVWNNVPELEVRVFKGGRTIYQEKTIVGQYKYATPFFSAPMRNIVVHPNWTVPPTIVKEDIAPKLQGPRAGGFFAQSKNNVLRRHGLAVSYKGEPINADTVDWNNVNIHKYTFTQDPGPANVLGQFKFNFPNKHAIYMHDTVQRELFAQRDRTLSHGCIRVHQPDRLAALLLGEDKGWSLNQVRSVVARNETKVISFKKRVPVHLTYFTVTVDENGTVRDFTDIYGIDARMAPKLFKSPEYFPAPVVSPVAETTRGTRPSQSRRNRTTNNGLDNFLSGLFGN